MYTEEEVEFRPIHWCGSPALELLVAGDDRLVELDHVGGALVPVRRHLGRLRFDRKQTEEKEKKRSDGQRERLGRSPLISGD